MKEIFPDTKQLTIQKEGWNIPILWNGYCPESWSKGKIIKMRLNDMDFYESEETGLQIAIPFAGVQAVILKFRGNSSFHRISVFAHERDNNECLTPHTLDVLPFCNPTVFKSSDEIKKYIDKKLERNVTKICFDETSITRTFGDAEKYLFDKTKIKNILYIEKSYSTFDINNSDFLKDVNKQSIVYCIWQGEAIENLQPKYVGHVSSTSSKQRMINHFSRKNEATGSQLERVKIAVEKEQFLGISFIVIEPAYMRMALEEWLIVKHSSILEWNKQGKKK